MQLKLQPTDRIVCKGNRQLNNLHILKGIAAIMVVCIHAAGTLPAWIEGITRYGVVGFLMITGYFLPDADGTLHKERIKHDLLKIMEIAVAAQLLYIAYHLASCLFYAERFDERFLNLHNWLDLLLFGRYFGYQLWYLHAVALALATLWLLVRWRMERLVYLIAIVGPIANLALGSYHFLYSDAVLSPFASRNFLTIGLPGLAMGIWMRRNERLLPSARTLSVVFALLVVASLVECHAIIDIKSRGDIMVMTLPGVMAWFALMLRLPQASVANPLVALGRDHSINIYIFHVMVIFLLYDLPPVRAVWDSFYFWLMPVTVLLSLGLSRLIVGRGLRVRTRLA